MCACNGTTTAPADPKTFEAIAPNGERFTGLTEHEAKVKATITGGTWRKS